MVVSSKVVLRHGIIACRMVFFHANLYYGFYCNEVGNCDQCFMDHSWKNEMRVLLHACFFELYKLACK